MAGKQQTWRSRQCRAFVTLVVGLLCIVLFQTASWPVSAQEKQRRIYFLESLTPTQPAAVSVLQGFRQRLQESSAEHFEILIDFLELGRFPGEAYKERTARYLAEKYAQEPPALLITLGRGAAQFLVKYRDVLGRELPVIFASLPAQSPEATNLPSNSVSVVTKYDSLKTLELARALQPEARNLVIVAGASEYDRAWLEEAKRDIAPFMARYNTRYIVGLPHADILKQVSQLPRDTIVLVLLLLADGSGRVWSPPEAAAEVARSSSAPTYSSIGTYFPLGIVGGYTDTFEAQGVAAANLAVRILSGRDVATLPQQTTAPHAYRVDARQLERWGLSESNLPAGTVVAFRAPTLWEQHRNLVLIAIAAFALQTVVLAVLLVQMQRRRQAEAEAELQRKEVSHLMRVSVLGELSGAIAHELNQPLTAILAYAQAARRLLAGKDPNVGKVTEVLGDIVHEDNRASEVIRRLHRLLRKGENKTEPINLNELVDSTVRLLNSEAIGRRIKVDVALDKKLPQTSGDPVQLQQVLLNLLVNAMDAMNTTAPTQRLITVGTRSSGNGIVEAFISDRGHGIADTQQGQLFQPFFTTKDHGLGLGLSICSTIVKTHGGKLSITNNSGGGATASFTLPAHANVAPVT